MASSKEYLDFILDQLSELKNIKSRAMMGEYIIYYGGKIIGGIYDDRLLIKPLKSALALIPNAKYEVPYQGAKEMILVEEVDDKEFLTSLFNMMYNELPEPKKGTSKNDSTELLSNIDKLHTTAMGVDRIKKNLGITEDDVVEFCRNKILSSRCDILKRGKNWYCSIDGIIITVNSFSYTIITAHREKTK